MHRDAPILHRARPAPAAARLSAALCRLGAALAVALATAAPAGAQLAVSAGGGWYLPGGADFDDTDGGAGYHATVSVPLGDGPLEMGVGGQWSRHAVGFSTDDYDVLAAYVEPRVWLGPGSPVHPYLAGRLAWVRQSIDVAGVGRHSDGVGALAELGVAVGVGPSVAVEGGLSLGLLSFGDFETDEGTLRGTDSSGRVVGLRLGLRIGG